MGGHLFYLDIEKNLTIMKIKYRHYIRRIYNWTSPGDKIKNEIHYIMTRSRFKTATMSSNAIRGSNHRLLVYVKLTNNAVFKREITKMKSTVDGSMFLKRFGTN